MAAGQGLRFVLPKATQPFCGFVAAIVSDCSGSATAELPGTGLFSGGNPEKNGQ
jgi:hypothetical protein